jgi:hypothetical protein
LQSTLHKTGHKKIRSDKVRLDKCTHCDYTTNKNLVMIRHILSVHSTQEERKAKSKYYCDFCDIGTNVKAQYNAHLLTSKHKNFEKFVSTENNKAIDQ